jgi:predicted Zn finger-like uncharacterized protein
MIIACPSCQKRFLVDDAVLPESGRNVRCAACAHTWLCMPEAPPSPEQPTPAAPRYGRHWLVFLMVASLIAIILYAARQPITHAFPGAQQLYALVGIAVHPLGYGLEFADLHAEQHRQGETPQFVIRGRLVNTSQMLQKIPKIKITYQTPGCETKESPCEVMEWSFQLPRDFIAAGEEMPFATDPRAMPPTDARGTITFA